MMVRDCIKESQDISESVCSKLDLKTRRDTHNSSGRKVNSELLVACGAFGGSSLEDATARVDIIESCSGSGVLCQIVKEIQDCGKWSRGDGVDKSKCWT
jgi:hypothetical protein